MPARIGRLGLHFYRGGVRLTLHTGAEPSLSGRAWVILDFDQVIELESRLLDWALNPYADPEADPAAVVRP